MIYFVLFSQINDPSNQPHQPFQGQVESLMHFEPIPLPAFFLGASKARLL